MNPFAETLARLRDRLDLPQPARTRVLVEIAADLDDLYRAHRAEGRSDDESRRLAIEAIDLSDEALAELAAVHAGPVRGLVDRLSPRGRTRLGQLGPPVVLLAVLAVGAPPFRASALVRDAGPLAGPVLAAGALALSVFLVKAWRLFVVRRHGPRDLRRGVDAVLALAAAALFVGAAASTIDLYLVTTRLELPPASFLAAYGRWLLRGSALLALSLQVALVGFVLWWALADRVARIERHEWALLQPDDPSTGRSS